MRQLAKLGLTLLLAFILALGLLVLAPALLAHGQNVNSRYDNILWTSSYVAGQTVLVPIPGAQVQVCAYPANGVPCTNLATLYAGPTTLGGTSLNPISSDAQGNFGFWAAAGYYQYTLTNSLGQSAGPYSITLGGTSAGAVYALFPSTQGVVFSTSPTNSVTATSSQIVAAANTSPTTQFSTALIPPLTSLIPATSFVLKGSGSAGSALAAVPGTDYIQPGAALSLKVINGISYSAAYTGATVDVRVNACLSDAMNLANGNTTGICDASAETGTLTTVAQINVGNSAGLPVTLLLPAQGQWRGGMTDGTSSTINQYGNTAIIGKGGESGTGSQFVIGATATSNLGYVFQLTPLGSQLNYIYDSNFAIVNVNGGPYVGHVTANGIGAYFLGPMYDSSTVDHVVIFDALDAISAEVSGFCCGAVFRNLSINGNYGTGVTPLVITNTSAFNLETLSVVHPGAGEPIIRFTDSSSHTSNVNIHGLYMETSNSDTSTALLQNSGYGSINLSSVTAKAEVASDAAPIMTSTNTTNTGITISGLNAVNGSGDFFYPVTAINNSYTSQVILTDSSGSKGNLGYYSNTSSSNLGTALLPGSPNAVYSFIALGDQTGTTIHDISGNSHNATFGGTSPIWTGTGLDFSQNSAASANLPAALNSDESFCISYYTAPWGKTASEPNGYYSLLVNSVSNAYMNWLLYYNTAFFEYAGTATVNGTEQQSGFHTYCLTIASGQDGAYTDGNPITFTNGGTTPVLASGNYVFGAGVFGGYENGIIQYFAAWPSRLTAAQIKQASVAMTAAVSAKGFQTTPPNYPTAQQYFAAVGDSITAGFTLSPGQDWVSNTTFNQTFTKVNLGTVGFITAQLLGMQPWEVPPAYCAVQGGRSIAIIFAGTNDSGIPVAAQTTYQHLAAWAAAVRAEGCLPGVGTMISRGGGSYDTFKDTLNPLIRAGAAQGLYFLIDFAANTNMGCDGCNSNATYFNGDLTHPTAAGQLQLDTEANNAVNSQIGASSAAPTIYASNTVTMASADNYATIIPTGAATATLPDCLGVTGNRYSIFNNSAGANTITFSGQASESITGSTTLGQSLNAVFQATLISQAAAGCGWQRVQ